MDFTDSAMCFPNSSKSPSGCSTITNLFHIYILQMFFANPVTYRTNCSPPFSGWATVIHSWTRSSTPAQVEISSERSWRYYASVGYGDIIITIWMALICIGNLNRYANPAMYIRSLDQTVPQYMFKKKRVPVIRHVIRTHRWNRC